MRLPLCKSGRKHHTWWCLSGTASLKHKKRNFKRARSTHKPWGWRIIALMREFFAILACCEALRLSCMIKGSCYNDCCSHKQKKLPEIKKKYLFTHRQRPLWSVPCTISYSDASLAARSSPARSSCGGIRPAQSRCCSSRWWPSKRRLPSAKCRPSTRDRHAKGIESTFSRARPEHSTWHRWLDVRASAGQSSFPDAPVSIASRLSRAFPSKQTFRDVSLHSLRNIQLMICKLAEIKLTLEYSGSCRVPAEVNKKPGQTLLFHVWLFFRPPRLIKRKQTSVLAFRPERTQKKKQDVDWVTN